MKELYFTAEELLNITKKANLSLEASKDEKWIAACTKLAVAAEILKDLLGENLLNKN